MIERLKGMSDKIGDDARKIDYLYEVASNIFQKYGYEKIITPLLESTELFKRTVGDETDIVNKEMYEFQDKGNRDVCLRPEGTAGVVRAYLEKGLHKSKPHYKCFYFATMYRYEKPQKGRYREFNQIGVEHFGAKTPLVDAEIIQMIVELLNEIGITDILVEINNIGNINERKEYIRDLKEYLIEYKEELSDDSKRRLNTNPLRILDSKDKKDIEIIENAPKLYNYLSEENKKYFNEVLELLKVYNIRVSINHNLVRGLDYYSSTVFEIKSDKLGAQSSLLGGGRYDGLLQILGNADIPAIGFAAGVERLIIALDEEKYRKYIENKNKYYAIYDEYTKEYMLEKVQTLRQNNITVEYEYSPKGFGNQIKKADKLGYTKVLIFGSDEKKENKITVKDLQKGTQELFTLNQIINNN